MDDKDVIIVGGGPGGLSAAVYAARNGLSTLVFDRGRCGGLVTEAPHVDNYLGIEKINGLELAERFRTHAARYAELREFEEVGSIEREDISFVINTAKGQYRSGAVIIATGSRHARLGVPGEAELAGKGVSYCATCDGFFFRDKDAIVVGGGNTAVIDAIHLHGLGSRVRLLHRKAELRAESALKDALEERKIDVIWNSVLTDISGEDRVCGVKLRNTVNGTERAISVDGVFVSVGEIPNNSLARALGVELDERGFVRSDPFQRTTVERVYAVGDIAGGVKQIIVACSEGAVAALAAFEDLTKPYWSTRSPS